MLQTKPVTRSFTFNKRNLPDPNPKLSPAQVKDLYASQYPELASAAIEGPELKDGQQRYSFVRQVGTKG
jgi:PRTRC genetic system protein C